MKGKKLQFHRLLTTAVLVSQTVYLVNEMNSPDFYKTRQIVTYCVCVFVGGWVSGGVGVFMRVHECVWVQKSEVNLRGHPQLLYTLFFETVSHAP